MRQFKCLGVMMFLSANEIQNSVDSGELVIEPFNYKHLKPISYVLQLSNHWLNWSISKEPIALTDSCNTNNLLSSIFSSEEYVLSNNDFCLGSTIEKVSLPDDIAAVIAPLSHIARWGLCVNLGSLFVSPGFGNTCPTSLTLELKSQNPSPLLLKSGLPICHLAFTRVRPGKMSYPLNRSVYDGLEAPLGPLMELEWSKMS
ncbi:MAG: hypothetical protein GF364_12590 [Candidatus Lokiarchaeota archaeon]|nr:hypothetical protein [Candidatus Lokiarchaeota archaeon]